MIYVDNMALQARVKNITSKWYHLVSIPKNNNELIKFAESIGLKKEWIQKPNKCDSHFDITENKRKLAIQKGAIPITTKELCKKLYKIKE